MRTARTDNANCALVAECRPALIAFFKRRRVTSVEAEDLAQEVILRALAHTGWRSDTEARAYIFTIAANLWRDRGRRLLTMGGTREVADLGELLAEEKEPARVLTYREELERVVASLLELGERTRDIFVLFRLERMKQAEIASMFGISVSAVEKHLAKAIAHLGARRRRE